MNQAISLGEALEIEAITHIFSSDLKRAYRTASAIAEHHPFVSVVPDKLFREQDFGDLEGKPWRQTWTSDMNNSTKSHAKSENGEPKAAMNERATSAWNWVIQHADIFDNPSDLFIVIVSHGLFLSALFKTICVFYNSPRPANIFWNNTAYLRFTVEPTRDPPFKIHRINETNHLTAVQRQKGGVGSSKYDESQKTMKDFFLPSTKKSNLNSGKLPSLVIFIPLPYDDKFLQTCSENFMRNKL
jgi:broad specificity phosphatase PhoE